MKAMCFVMQQHSRGLTFPSQTSANFLPNHEPTAVTRHWDCIPCKRGPLLLNGYGNMLRNPNVGHSAKVRGFF